VTSGEPNAGISTSRRPLRDDIFVRLPFLADFAAAAASRLRPGSPLRQRGIKWAFRIAWEANSRGDFEPARLAYERDAEVVLFGAEGLGLAGRYSGERGWTEFIGDIFENFSEPRWTTQRVRDAGDRLVAEMRLTASGKVSGAPVRETIATVYYLSSGGKIARQEVFWRPDSWNLALKAAGLSE
jgi:ketosteroid isomerase-like protein